MKSAAQQLWEKQLLAFVAHGRSAYEEFDELTAAGKSCDWETVYEPAWRSFRSVTHCWVRWAAMAKFACMRSTGSQSSLNYFSRLRTQCLSYYAAVPCESDPDFRKLTRAEQAKRVRTERRQRWASMARYGHERFLLYQLPCDRARLHA